jgi:hypothetical protein
MMVAACSGDGAKGGNSTDMAMCSPAPEICDGKDNNCNGQIDELTASTANNVQLVANSILLPKTRTDYSIDLNGDGYFDNQLSSLVAILKSQGNDANAQIAVGITNGDQILLFDEMSGDSTFQADACASADVFTGMAQANPDLTGGGHFVVDPAFPPGAFSGVIAAGTFDSVRPEDQKTPLTLTLSLVMFKGKTLTLPLIGAHVMITRDPAGKVSGQIHGAIRKDDVQNKILPQFAGQVHDQVMNFPMDPSSQTLLAFFDDGGTPDPDHACTYCKNSDGSCAMKGDDKIDPCEIISNAAVQSVVASDVQMFSDDGTTYQPNPMNTHKDSLSLGIGFTAVAATF